jgi:tetratricopeptide (TPR) repeat protein
VLFCNLALAQIKLHQTDKAFASLRRSVALGPMNRSAVYMLADLAFEHGRNDEVVPALRHYVMIDTRSAGVWSRLARALYQIGDFAGAMEALHSEASVSESAGVWNNLGVVHGKLGSPKQAISAFKRGFEVGKDRKEQDYFLVATNLARHLEKSATDKQFLEFTTQVAGELLEREMKKSSQTSSILIYALIAMYRTNKLQEVEVAASRMLSAGKASDDVAAWIIGSIVGSLALNPSMRPKAITAYKKYSDIIDRLKTPNKSRLASLYNNIAFAFIENGDILRGETFARKSISLANRDPFPVATLGLLDIRKGNIERGSARYRRAISLSKTRTLKECLRQKLDLELGRYWLQLDVERARRHLDKVGQYRLGDENIAADARRLLNALPGN